MSRFSAFGSHHVFNACEVNAHVFHFLTANTDSRHPGGVCVTWNRILKALLKLYRYSPVSDAKQNPDIANAQFLANPAVQHCCAHARDGVGHF